MIVVSDTSPLTALLTVGEDHILRDLFGEVIIPSAVFIELLRTHTELPDWIKIGKIENFVQAARYAQIVDIGEAQAIELAQELHADRLLIDERKGRNLAIKEGVPVIGLLGIILLAKRKGLIASAKALLSRLDNEAGVYLARDLVNDALKTVDE